MKGGGGLFGTVVVLWVGKQARARMAHQPLYRAASLCALYSFERTITELIPEGF